MKQKSKTRLIEIPPAIYDRLLFLTCIADIVYSKSITSSGNAPIRVVDYDGKHYLSNAWSLSADSDRYILASLCSKTFKELMIYGIFLPQREYEHPI